MSYPIHSAVDGNAAARLAMRRYGISREVLADALKEAGRARANGGLAALGSILEQRRVVCAGVALELNRVEAPLRKEAAVRARRRAKDERRQVRAREARVRRASSLSSRPRSKTRCPQPKQPQDLARWRAVLDQAWARLEPRILTPETR